MTKSRWAEQTGIFLMVGGICAAVASFIQLVPENTIWNGLDLELIAVLAVPAYLLVGIEYIGLALRDGGEAGPMGQVALLTSGVGALAIGFPFVFQLIAWSIHHVVLVVYAVGTIVVGLIHWRTPVLPAPRLLPLTMGLLVIFGVFQTPVEGDADIAMFFNLIGSGAGWFMMGIAVHRSQHGHIVAAV